MYKRQNVNREWEFASSFTKAPGSSPDAIANSSSLDEIHIAVIDEDGLITGIVGEILEIFEGVSMASDAKDSEGNSNYFVDKLRYNSNYIFFSNHNSNLSESGNTFASAGAIFDTHTLPITQSFTNGTDGYCLTSGQKKAGIETYLGDAETQDVDFLISGPLNGDDGSGNDVITPAEATTQANNLISIANARKDLSLIHI